MNSHVQSVKRKAVKILGLLRRNFSGSSQYVKTQAYNSLVRPHVEYASAAWNLSEKQHIKKKRIGSCPTLRYEICLLGWDTLEVRRHLSAATMMFKAVHNETRLTFPASVTLVHRGNRSNHPHKFRRIFARTNAYKFSFSCFPTCYPPLE